MTSWSNGCEQCPVTHHCTNLWLWIPGYVGKCSSQGTFSVVRILCHSPPSLTAPWLTWKLEVFHPSVRPPRDPPTRTMVSHYWSKPQFCTNEEAQRELCRKRLTSKQNLMAYNKIHFNFLAFTFLSYWIINVLCFNLNLSLVITWNGFSLFSLFTLGDKSACIHRVQHTHFTHSYMWKASFHLVSIQLPHTCPRRQKSFS